MQEDTLESAIPSMTGIGRLGALVREPFVRQGGLPSAHSAQIDMIERRILRIEKALRLTGIEVEQIDL